MSNTTYPFSAIIGQPRLKLALMLCAVEPKIGGILLTGARGTAKSTIARALLDLMPEGGDFVTLPLGASEERISGTLNIEKVLADGGVDFAPGLLQKAHGGILYVDEVNLLADHLVDLLLDVAASGVNTVERDGISHQHPSEFILVGTMNPEEGELRPQLLDRYGLCVQVNNDFSAQERTDIVRARLAYDTDPQAFVSQYTEQQQALIGRCHQARTLLPKVEVNDNTLLDIAERCTQGGVEGLRADIVIHRAASAHAALDGRTTVTRDDIDAVEEFALLHRRQPDSQPPAQTPPSHAPQQNDRQENKSHENEGDWGEIPPTLLATGERRQPADTALASVSGTKKKHC